MLLLFGCLSPILSFFSPLMPLLLFLPLFEVGVHVTGYRGWFVCNRYNILSCALCGVQRSHLQQGSDLRFLEGSRVRHWMLNKDSRTKSGELVIIHNEHLAFFTGYPCHGR